MQTPRAPFSSSCRKYGKWEECPDHILICHLYLESCCEFLSMEGLKEDDSNNSNQLLNHVRDSLYQTLKLEEGARETFNEKKSKVHVTLSFWLKLPYQFKMGQMLGFERRTLGDIPILATVAAHWNEDEPSRHSRFHPHGAMRMEHREVREGTV